MTQEKTTPERAPKTILVLRSGDWTEAVLTSFVVPALKEKYPEAAVTLLLRESLSDWVPCLHGDDSILVGDSWPRSGMNFFILALKLRRKRFDLAVDLDGFATHPRFLKWAGVGRNVSAPHGEKLKNEIDRGLNVLAQLGITPHKLNFKLKVRQQVHDDIMLRLARLGIRSGHFLAVAPGGSVSHKRWKYFPEFLRLVCERTKWPVLLFGGPGERELGPALVQYNHERIFSWIGETTREETLAAIGEAAAFVGCDTAVSHVAGTAGIPGVILYGPSSPAYRHPPGKGQRVICLEGTVPCSPCQKNDGTFNWNCRDHVCMKAISPETVWKALIQAGGAPKI